MFSCSCLDCASLSLYLPQCSWSYFSHHRKVHTIRSSHLKVRPHVKTRNERRKREKMNVETSWHMTPRILPMLHSVKVLLKKGICCTIVTIILNNRLCSVYVNLRGFNGQRLIDVVFHVIISKPFWEWDRKSCIFLRFGGIDFGDWKQNIGAFVQR